MNNRPEPSSHLTLIRETVQNLRAIARDPNVPAEVYPSVVGAYNRLSEFKLQLELSESLDITSRNNQHKPQNQCDGCVKGMRLKDGIHYNVAGDIHMGCTADRYQDSSEPLNPHFRYIEHLISKAEHQKSIVLTDQTKARLQQEIDALNHVLSLARSNA